MIWGDLMRMPGGGLRPSLKCNAPFTYLGMLRRHLGGVLLGQKGLDLAHRHAARVHGDDLVVKAGEAPLVLGMRIGSKEPARSRGTSMRRGPSSVSTVSALRPLRWLPASSGLAASGE